MASCFELNSVNQLELSSSPIETCTGFVVQTMTEYQSNITIHTLFAVPADTTQLIILFSGGFMLPIAAYFYAHIWGVLLNFMDK